MARVVAATRERVALGVGLAMGLGSTAVSFVSLLFWVFVYAAGRTLTLPRAVWWLLDVLYAVPLPVALVAMPVVSVVVGVSCAFLALSTARSW